MISRERIMAMTTNERLFEAGLMADFDNAVRVGDAAQAREILKSVFVDDASIELIISDLIG